MVLDGIARATTDQGGDMPQRTTDRPPSSTCPPWPSASREPALRPAAGRRQAHPRHQARPPAPLRPRRRRGVDRQGQASLTTGTLRPHALGAGASSQPSSSHQGQRRRARGVDPQEAEWSVGGALSRCRRRDARSHVPDQVGRQPMVQGDGDRSQPGGLDRPPHGPDDVRRVGEGVPGHDRPSPSRHAPGLRASASGPHPAGLPGRG